MSDINAQPDTTDSIAEYYGPIFYILSAFKILILIWLIKVVYHYFIKPYLSVKYYKSQGGVGFFGFGVDSMLKSQEDMFKEGDWYFWQKGMLKKNPAIRFFIRNWGSQAVVTLMQPKDIKEFLDDKVNFFKDPSQISTFKHYSPKSIFLQEGEKHSEKRKALVSAFKDWNVTKYSTVALEVGYNHLMMWQKQKDMNKIALMNGLIMIQGDVIGKVFFGRSYFDVMVDEKPLNFVLIQLFNESYEANTSFKTLIFGDKIANSSLFSNSRSRQKMATDSRKVIKELIQKVKNPNEEDIKKFGEDKSLVQTLLKAGVYSEDEIVDEFIHTFAQSCEPVVHLMMMLIYELTSAKSSMKKVKEELTRSIPNIMQFDLRCFNQMPYLHAAIKETLRLRGPLGTTVNRVAANDVLIGKIKVKKDTLVNVCVPALHTSEQYYSKPDQFLPERWLPEFHEYDNDGCKTEHHTFIPFSTGNRECLGEELTFVQTKVILALLLKMFKVKVEPEFKLRMNQRYWYESLAMMRVDLVKRGE